jgi:hypothetical protein
MPVYRNYTVINQYVVLRVQMTVMPGIDGELVPFNQHISVAAGHETKSIGPCRTTQFLRLRDSQAIAVRNDH